MSIKVRNLSKNYGISQAVKDISFDVNTGEILGFLGPNGAGKTTTMKIITCFMPPTQGTVEVDGYNIYDHSVEVRRKIGYLPESNPLYTDMNVVDFLKFTARLHGIPQADMRQRLREMVDVCGLGDVRHKDIGELSKGYRQRVGLAQAMIHDPDVLILDEPTSGLDPNQIIEIRNLIRRIGLAKTVILSTHILSEVQATCDRVIIINDGSIVADGKIDQLQEDFRGGEIIRLELKADVEDPMKDIFPHFEALEGASSAEYVRSEDAFHRFVVHSPKGMDLRESIFRTVVGNNWVLLGMERETTSLEEVFRDLTRTELPGYGNERSNWELPRSDTQAPPAVADENETQPEKDGHSKYMPDNE